jgi:hypothetical protein
MSTDVTIKSGAADANHPDPVYTLTSFLFLLEPLLRALPPGGICEVGVEQGFMTERLIELSRKLDRPYTGIDPTLTPEFVERYSGPQVSFRVQLSLDALPHVEDCALYILDGDHNYYTVYHELKTIYRDGRRAPVVALHDVGWPWGRRDQYCSPDRIPAHYRHPYRDDAGAIPDRTELIEGRGFIGKQSAYYFAAATQEGGSRNGVRTALDEFCAEDPEKGWECIHIPAFYGFALLWRPSALSQQASEYLHRLKVEVGRWAPLLGQLEQARIVNMLAALDIGRAYRELEAHSDQLAKEYEGLTKKYQELTNTFHELIGHYNNLKAHADNLEQQNSSAPS